MTYQVPSSEIAISYNNVTYVVTLTPASDPASFRIKSPIDGSIETVDASTAAHLFGAEQAYSLLGRLYGTAHADQSSTYWTNVLQSDAQILGWSAASNILSSVSGLVLGGLITGGGTVAAGSLSTFVSLTQNMAPSLSELAFTTAAVHDATLLLSQATVGYNAIQNSTNSNRNAPISYDAIKAAIDNTLISLYTGNAATQAASNIPIVNGNVLDDIVGFAGNFASSFAGAVTKIKGVFTAAQINLIDNADNATDLIGLVGDVSDLHDFVNSISNVLMTAEATRYGPLTSSGLALSAAALQGQPSVNVASHVSLYSISPNPGSLNEKSGIVTFTITRTDTSQAATVYVSTVQDQGISNPNNNYYYNGLLNKPITFAANVATATVQLTINDIGLTSGAEAFRLIVQQNANDPYTTSLASDTFTIVNNDLPPASNYTITPNAPQINEKAGVETFTIARTNTSQAVTVYVSTVHDQGADNPNGNYYYKGLLNQPVIFAAGVATAQVQVTINDLGLTSGSENFRLIVQQHSTDSATTTLASDVFTILNNDTGIIANATVSEPVNTTFLLQPFLSLPAPPSGVSISLVNFINAHTGPGQLTFGGTATPGNTAVAYANVGQVGFSTGSVTGSDKIEMYATYSNGTTSNVVDLTVTIQSTTPQPTPPPQNSSGPVINAVQSFQVTVGQQGVLSSTYLSASDAAYTDPSLITYNISAYPTKGVIYDNGQFAHSFTQADINAGRVTYQASMQVGLASETTDSFSYTVSDPSFRQSPLTTVALKIEPLPAPPQTSQPYIDINVFPTVSEGGQIFVLGNRFSVQDLHVTDPNPNIPSIYTGSILDSVIVYTVVQGPTHGKLVWFTNTPTLWLPGQSSYFGQQVTQFTQNDLNNGWFVYQNDFTSGAADHFSFTVSDGFGGTIGLTTATIPIQPVNPIILGIDSGIFVTPGGQSIISPDWLRITDNAPAGNAGLVFTLIQAPSHGSLLVSGQPVSTFTANNIGNYAALLTYRQDGSPAQTDQIILGVSDPYGNSIPDLIVPVTIAASALDRNTGTIVGIGQSVAIGNASLDVADPGMRSGNINADPPYALVYTITALPARGALSVNGSTLQLGGQFNQDQLDKSLLIYTEDGSNATSDSFGFSISDIFYHNNYGSGTFNIGIVNNNGGRNFVGASNADLFYSGLGNNWIAGDGNTVLSYALAPTGVTVNLVTGVASNGFGGTDTIVGVSSVVGSSNADAIVGSASPDTLLGGAGSDILTGGAGADRFVFDSASLADAQAATPVFDRVVDYDQGSGSYNFAEGDQLDLSAVLSAAYNKGSGQAVSSLVRAVEDSSGIFANLQIDPDGTANGANWITIARLDGLHVGNNLSVILDALLPIGTTISVTATNQPPVLNAAGGSLSYTENQAATAIDAGLTVTDVDSASLTGATVAITGNYQSGEDVLGFTNQNGITGSFNAGVLTLSGSASVTNYQTALRAVTYFDNSDTPSAATRTVSYQVDDGQSANHASNVVNATVAVTPVNDAPSGANKTVTTLEDTAYTLVASDFGFSDVDGNALAAVKITTLPGAGTLKDNGVAVTAGQFVSVADISGNKLVFAPAANANGNSYASFTFQVQDNGGTANGGVDTDQSPNTLTFNVTPVNDAPSGANKTVTTLEDTAYTLAASDFGFSDVDGNALAAVKITTLPGAGTLKDNGVAVTAGQFVSVADISGNKLVFTPAANANGNSYASFTFQVQDNGGTANGGVDTDQSPNTLTFNVTPVNDAPSGTNKTVTTLEDTAYTLAASDFGFSDVDGNALAAVKITTLLGAGTLKDNGVAVTAGQFVSVADISGNKLVFTPAANANGNSYASFTFQVQDNGGTANGGVDTDQSPNTLTFNVSPLPTLTAGGQSYSLGAYTIYNNNWGASGLVIGRDYTQQIVFNPNNINSNIVMSWNYPEVQGADLVYGYPEIFWGNQNGLLGPGTLAYLNHVSNIKSLSVSYSTSISGETSKFDVGAEIWVVTGSGAVTAEIFVMFHRWTWNGITIEAGTTYSDSQLGISGSGTAVETIHYNSGGGPAHTLVTIQTTSDLLSGQIDFAPILKNLIAQGIINASDYVAGVELGSEMIMGSGSLTVNSFSVVENAGPNQVPVVHVTGSISVQPNGWLQASLAAFAPVFNVTDGDNDPVVTYRFIDVGTAATSMHLWTTAGGYLAQGATAEVAAAQLSSAWLQGGSVNGTDTLRVQVFDGYDWSAPADITVLTRGPNHVPVVSAATTSGAISTNVALASIFGVTDGDSDPIVQYRVTDATAGASSAHLLLNGQAQAESTQFTIDAANLSAWQIATSSVSRSVNAFTVQAYDGFDWSAATTINFTSLGPNQVPVVHVTGSISVQPNGWLQASLAAFAPVFNVTDGDNDPVVTYRFIDVGTAATSMHLWTTAGGYLAQGATAEVAAAQLSSAWLQGGSVNGTDTLRVQVFDGYDWSAPADITVLTRGPNHVPVVSAATTSGAISTNVALASIFGVTDGDSDPIVQYRVTDATAGASSAHLLLNGQAQAESTQFTIDAANLSAWQIATSSVSRSVNAFTVQAYDGFDWSAATTINFTSLGPNQVPVVHVTGSISVQPNGWLQASLAAFAPVFNVTDGDNDPVVTYRFIDVGTAATSMHLWTTAGGYLAQGATAEVAAAQLSSAWLQGGSVNGTDTLRVQVFDGYDWSAPADITVLTRGPNHVPVVSAATTSGAISTNVALASIFGVTDGDSDPIVQYRVTDATAGASSAHLLLNGQAQAESTQFTIDAANLSAWQIATSSVSRSVNAFTVQAYDGFDWSAATTINFTSLGPNQVPVVHVTGSISVQPNGWLQASLAAFAPVFNVTDGDNDPVVTYRFIDVGTAATSMHLWTTAGGYLAQGATAEVAAAQLSSAWLQGGSVNGTDTLRVQVFDGYDWSAPADITVLTRGPNHVPVVSAATTSGGLNTTLALSSLFSVTDADSDPITQYKIMDATVGGAHLLLNGVQQAENTIFTIDAADLSKWQIVTSSISHDMNQFQISASDGFGFSDPATISVISGNSPPAETVTSGLQLTPNQWLDFNTSNLPISVTDADGDPVVTYRFTDVGSGATTSHLWYSAYSGGYLPQGGTVDVPAAQLSSFWIQGDSSGGIDTLRVQVSDGFIWSAPREISVITSSTPVNVNVGAHIVAGTTTGANDILTGSAASDTFVFAPNFGNDTINNYTPGQDEVAIDHTVFATAAAALAAAVDMTGNAVIHVDANDSITITGTSVATLIQHQSDFHIV